MLLVAVRPPVSVTVNQARQVPSCETPKFASPASPGPKLKLPPDRPKLAVELSGAWTWSITAYGAMPPLIAPFRVWAGSPRRGAMSRSDP